MIVGSYTASYHTRVVTHNLQCKASGLLSRVQMEIENSGDNSRLGLRKGAWSPDEDLLLSRYIRQHGEGNWHLIPKNTGLNRCRKSCRLRWLNYLSPSIKRGHFDPDEIDLIVRLHKLLGNRWSLIAGRIPGRTANDVKNFWNIHLKKKFKSNILPKFNTSKRTEVIRPRARTFSKELSYLHQKLVGKEQIDGCLNLKHPCNEEEEMFPQQGDDYWQQCLSISDCFIPNTTLGVVEDSLEQQTLPRLSTDWDDLLLENTDIWSLLD